MSISTHVLDVAVGRPAAGVDVTLEHRSESGWTTVGEGTTDADGRVASLLEGEVSKGTYRIIFAITAYQEGHGTETFFPEVTVTFMVRDQAHHHVPLLLSPYGYSTYRGS